LLRELHGHGPDRFDPNLVPHYHFHCTRCGRVFDVGVSYKGELDRIDVGPGFAVVSHEIIWEEICPSCRGKEGS
jgi:Fe2+ or Zn2+ uptake regulation protein